MTIAYAFSSPYQPGSTLFGRLCSSTGVPEWLPSSSLDYLEEMDIYKETLAIFRKSFALPWQQGEALSAKLSVSTFVGSVPRRYLELLSVLRPVALVILCYMCMLLQEC
jgi:hypothetical protein